MLGGGFQGLKDLRHRHLKKLGVESPCDPASPLGNREDVSGCESLETPLTGWKDKRMGRQNALGSNLTLTLTGAWWTPWRGWSAEPTVTRPPGVTGSGAEPGHQDLLWEVAHPGCRVSLEN